MHLEGLLVHLDGPPVHLEGRLVHLDGFLVHLEGPLVHLEGHLLHLESGREQRGERVELMVVAVAHQKTTNEAPTETELTQTRRRS